MHGNLSDLAVSYRRPTVEISENLHRVLVASHDRSSKESNDHWQDRPFTFNYLKPSKKVLANHDQ